MTQLLAVAAAAGVGMAFMVLFIGVGRIIESRASLRERLDALAPVPAIEDTAAEASLEDTKPTSLRGRLNRLISGQAFASSTATELARANLPLTTLEYLFLRIGSTVALFLFTMVFTQQLAIAAVAAIAGFYLPRLYVQRRQAKRHAAFQSQLVDVLTLLVGSLRSGYGMTIAMDNVSKQMPSPSSEEFGRVVREIGLGLPAMQALRNMVRRVPSADLDLVVTAVIIQYEIGGNLAQILETISETIRERIRIERHLHVLTTQQRMQRIILTALPPGLGLIIYLLNPEYLMGLFTPGPTMIIPIGAVVLMGLGYAVMGKLSQLEV
jgi:tight adherence protein B